MTRLAILSLLLVACSGPIAHEQSATPSACTGTRCVKLPACSTLGTDPAEIERSCRQSCERKTDCPTGFACRETEAARGRICVPCGERDCMPPTEGAAQDDDATCPCTTH
jgi:hypothetical protein